MTCSPRFAVVLLLAVVTSVLVAHAAVMNASHASEVLVAGGMSRLPPAAASAASVAAAAQDAATIQTALPLDRPTRRLIQRGLSQEGFDPGPPDGLFGPRTRTAIRGWQAANDAPVTGYLDRTQASTLREAGLADDVEPAGDPVHSPAPSDSTAAISGIDSRRCTSRAPRANCWKALANHSGCYVWVSASHALYTGRWSGACVNGYAEGVGTLTWAGASAGSTASGQLDQGKQQGTWVEGYSNGDVAEIEYVDGVRNGKAVLRYASGDVAEGRYMNGGMSGTWTTSHAGGGKTEGLYLNGERHGRWTLVEADGSLSEGAYANGRRAGPWIVRDGSGGVREGPYIDGKAAGEWVFRYSDETVHKGLMADGQRNGLWTIHYRNGSTEQGPYVTEQGPYVDGRRKRRLDANRGGALNRGPRLSDAVVCWAGRERGRAYRSRQEGGHVDVRGGGVC